MTSVIEMLPLPTPNGDYTNPYDGDDLENFAHVVAEHNVKKRDAEIEALRAENKGHGIAIQQLSDRAERLAEALRELLIDVTLAQSNMRRAAKTDPRWEGCDEAIQPRVDAARAALRDHDQEGGNP